MPSRPCLLTASATFALAITGCAWFGGGDEDEQEIPEGSQQTLYEEAQRSLRSGNYASGILRLQRLEARFPFGDYAEQAQLEIIHAHYMLSDEDAARAAAERFIRLHPQHPNVDYAYYMRGLIALAKGRGVFTRIFGTDLALRDVTHLKQAFTDFGDFVTLFPDSEYATDARLRMIYLRDVLARAELKVATYYLGRRAYIGAANRARYIVENFSQTSAAPDALAVLVEANWQLGLHEAADDALQVLALNFPDFHAFDDDGRLVLDEVIGDRERSLLNLVSLGLLGRPKLPPPLKIERPATQTASS
ncbi:MAG: outer membrane protein assembly factor BamD [Gammaproteobacteria bacterium]|nr:outer membrane protein assembly factor BamD [Gammaproteobacteria bacterium]